MSTLRNKVNLIGNIGNDPEIQTLDSGRKLAKLTLATNEVYKIIEKYVTKGKEIAVEGKLSHRSYDDKSGEKKYSTEVIISEVLLLGK
jgi:single-strand DNA-binding protein